MLKGQLLVFACPVYFPTSHGIGNLVIGTSFGNQPFPRLSSCVLGGLDRTESSLPKGGMT